MTIENPNIIHDEYYPYIKEGVSKFYDNFVSSSSNIFIALGPPGTGKSSFIRNMVVEKKLSVYLTYDDSMLESDSFFIEFLTNSSIDTLIIEDADLLMSKREHDGNKIMRKLLNISDGIVKVMNKKMIFSANITDPSNIDKALMRPGRCFGLVDFRKLTKSEAEAAAKKANLELKTNQSEYSLAEIFVQNNVKKTRFGFI
jgi:SpoVK/Ycf46/Vps4 family AAA+-type ATPase